MVLIGLLLVALACLVLGLVLASAAWLIGSLVASVAAAVALWQTRERIGAPSAAHTAKGASAQPAAEAAATTTGHGGTASGTAAPAASATGTSAPATSAPATTDAEPQLDQDYLARRAAWFAEGTGSGEVWVIDGRPDYHRPGCTQLRGTQTEPIPRSQALEDGFTPCGSCTPDADEPADPASLAPDAAVSGAGSGAAAGSSPAAAADSVWVVDGRPRYHRVDCMIISGQHAEAVPYAQASADGFMPCTLCEPDAART